MAIKNTAHTAILSYRDATQNDLLKIAEIYNSTVPARMVTADTGLKIRQHCQMQLFSVEGKEGLNYLASELPDKINGH